MSSTVKALLIAVTATVIGGLIVERFKSKGLDW